MSFFPYATQKRFVQKSCNLASLIPLAIASLPTNSAEATKRLSLRGTAKDHHLTSKNTILTLTITLICGAVFLLTQGCDREGPISTNTEYVNHSSLGIEIYQGPSRVEFAQVDSGKQTILSANLEAKTFQIRVPALPYGNAMKLCVWTDDSIFQLVAIGSSIQNTPFFSLGTGMAASNKPSDKLMLKNNAHHYLIEQRLEYISKGLRGITVKKLNINRKEYSVSKQKSPIYMVVFIDSNNDKIIDNNEIDFLELKF